MHLVKVTVEKDNQIIEAEDVTLSYGDDTQSIEAEVTKGDGSIIYTVVPQFADIIEVDSVTGAITPKEVGTAVVIVTAAETANYFKTEINVKVTVEKADQVITADKLIVKYGDNNKKLEPELNVGEGNFSFKVLQLETPDAPDVATYGDASEAEDIIILTEEGNVYPINVGVVPVLITASETEHYKETSTVIEVEVVPLEVEVTPAANMKKIKGEDDPEFTYKVISADPEIVIPEDELSDGMYTAGKLTREEGEDVGTYAYTLDDLADNNKNYSFSLADDADKFTIRQVPGSIAFEVESPEDALITVVTPGTEIIDQRLTEEDYQALDDGKDIRIFFKIEEKTPNQVIVDAMKNVLGENSVIDRFYDITFYKQIGDEEPVKIDDAGFDIEFSATITDEMQNSDPDVERTFKIVRFHNLITEVLDSEVNSEEYGDFIVFASGKFSYYGVGYSDIRRNSDDDKKDDDKKDDDKKDDDKKDGDNKDDDKKDADNDGDQNKGGDSNNDGNQNKDGDNKDADKKNADGDNKLVVKDSETDKNSATGDESNVASVMLLGLIALAAAMAVYKKKELDEKDFLK